MLGSTNFQNAFDSGPFLAETRETAVIHSVRQMSNGDSQGEFQADGVTAEQFDPSTNASPSAALTATATQQMVNDITKALGMYECTLVKTSSNRASII